MSIASVEEPYVVEDLCRFSDLIKLLSDGSVIRTSPSLEVEKYEDAKYPTITWHDVTFDPVYSLQLRVYEHSDKKPETIVVYFHGGGYCFGSRKQWFSHNHCLRLAGELGAMVVSVDYRLAPENRLPAAVEDCWTGLKWVKSIYREGQRVFVYGDSAGATLAHHLAVRIGSGGSSELDPVQVQGWVLTYPGFGGVERTKSERECPLDSPFSLDYVDRYYRLALPIGENADHPALNPFGPRSPKLEQLDLGPMLVMAGDADILYDRAKDYTRRLSKLGKKVKFVEFKGQGHGFLLFNPEKAIEAMSLTRTFIAENSV